MKLRRYISCLCVFALFRLTSGSWKVQEIGLAALDQQLAIDKPVIAVFWHGDFPALLPLLKGRKVRVFTSLSTRGDIIACVLSRFGYRVCQIPDRGGSRSLAIMKAALRHGQSAAIAVDGPLGPSHVVHRGAVVLAAELGYPVVPISICAADSWRLNQRWDQLHIPRLFSRVCLVVGPSLSVSQSMARGQLALDQRRVAEALDASAQQAKDCLSI